MNDNLTKTITELELELLKPEVRRSAEKLSDLLAEDFFEFGKSGKIYNKEQSIEQIPKGNSAKKSEYKATNFSIKEIAPDTVLATYETSSKDSSGNKVWALRSSIWQRRKGKWQIIFHQGTPKAN